MRLSISSATAAIAFVAAATLGGAPASAQEAINLSVVSGYAPTAALVEVFEDYYIPEVDRRLAEAGEYRINWNKGFSGTIVKPRGELDAISTGVADMAIVVPVFHVDKVPLYNVSFVVPFATGNLNLVTKAMNQIAEEVPEFKAEWDALGTVFLGSAGSVNNYQAVCTANKETVEAFRGTKVVGAGTNLLYFSGVGAVGISSNLGDYYNQMQTGIAECASVWAESAAGFKMYEVAPYFIKIDQGATNSFAVAANKSYWDGLPEPVRTVLAEVAIGYGDALADYVNEVSEKGIQAYRDNGGTIVEYTDEQRKAWAESLPDIAGDWAEAADKLGKPGSAVLARYMEILRENGETPLRDWTAE
jgi:C4-dicarboxylate-binding protein DctP